VKRERRYDFITWLSGLDVTRLMGEEITILESAVWMALNSGLVIGEEEMALSVYFAKVRIEGK